MNTALHLWRAAGYLICIGLCAAISEACGAEQWDKATTYCLFLLILDKIIERSKTP